MAAKHVDAQIPLTDDTRSELRSMKRGGERYEDVLQRLIDHYGEGAARTSDGADTANTET